MLTIGVSSYSLNQAIADGRMTQYEAIDQAALLGFKTIDFSVMTLPGESIKQAAPRLKRRALDAGIQPANYAVGADFLRNDWKAEVERLKQELDAAALMGVRTFRHDASAGFPAGHSGSRSFASALPILAEACLMVTEYANTLGIRTMVENHGYFCQDSERVKALAKAVNHPNFGILLDIGNFACADEDSLEAVARLAPYAFHLHAKDFHTKPFSPTSPGRGWFNTRSGQWLRGAIIGHGDLPIEPCLRLVKNAGYQGPVAVEFEGIEDCLLALADGKANLQAMIDRLP